MASKKRTTVRKKPQPHTEESAKGITLDPGEVTLQLSRYFGEVGLAITKMHEVLVNLQVFMDKTESERGEDLTSYELYVDSMVHAGTTTVLLKDDLEEAIRYAVLALRKPKEEIE